MTVKENEFEHTGFDITAASEVMSIFCLSSDYQELRKKGDTNIKDLPNNIQVKLFLNSLKIRH